MDYRQTEKGSVEHEKIIEDLERALDLAFEAVGGGDYAFQKATQEVMRLLNQLERTLVPVAARPEIIRRLKAKGMRAPEFLVNS